MVLQLHRVAFSLVVCAIAGTSAAGQDQKNVEAEPASSLQIGDKAPKLEVDHWLGGGTVESFTKDKLYVVEFWATWCAPCIKSMPHLSQLAERFSKDGLVVVAMTTADAANTREAVEQFINGRGKDFRFRYAMCESDVTYKAYMEASGQKGIPCSFVIDREGKVAYIGHPHDLDYVLERIVAGKWRGKADVDEIREMNESIGKLGNMAQNDPDKALQIVEHIRRVNPQRAKGLDFSYVELMIFCQKKMFDRAKELVELCSQGDGKATDWGAVAMLSGLLGSKEANPEGHHFDFVAANIKAAEDALKDDWQNLVQVGVAYRMLGDTDKFKACMDRVIEKCPDQQTKNALKMAIEMQRQAGGK